MKSQEITLYADQPITLGELSLALTAGGHRITTQGDRNLALLSLGAPDMETLEIHLAADGYGRIDQAVEFGRYHIRLLSLGDDGNKLTLSVDA